MWGGLGSAVSPAGLGTRTGTAAAFTVTVSRSPGAARGAAGQRKAARVSATSAGGPRTTGASSFELRPNGKIVISKRCSLGIGKNGAKPFLVWRVQQVHNGAVDSRKKM